MKIAQIAPLYESVPPNTYGGTERVIAALCDGLVARGHEVTLFAPAGSETAATLVPTAPSPVRMHMTRREMVEVAPHLHLKMLADVYEHAAEFDVIHSHVDIWTLPFVRRTQTPTVLTMHGRLDVAQVRDLLPLYPDVPLVSISDAQRRPLERARVWWAATVHNGLDLDDYSSAQVARGQHLAFVGRIHPEKGPETAVHIARQTGRELRVAAKIDPMDLKYYRSKVEPLFDADDVSFLGELDESRKPAFYASAAATLFPSDWPEPFGLVMIESMAAGTPVIALRRGAVAEVIVDGVTGFICDNVDEMVAAVARIGELDPDECRRHAATFSEDRMCAGYEDVYEALVGASFVARAS